MQQHQPAAGLSPDGYITDQDFFTSLLYRGMPANINGCGPIAAFNLRHFLTGEEDWRAVFAEMEALHRIHAPGPTSLRVMRLYLARHVPELRQAEGCEEALALARESRAGVIRYREGQVPHFISFLRREDGLFRFFNVDDGLEDCTMSMDDFGIGHLQGGLTVALTVL